MELALPFNVAYLNMSELGPVPWCSDMWESSVSIILAPLNPTTYFVLLAIVWSGYGVLCYTPYFRSHGQATWKIEIASWLTAWFISLHSHYYSGNCILHCNPLCTYIIFLWKCNYIAGGWMLGIEPPLKDPPLIRRANLPTLHRECYSTQFVWKDFWRG